MAKTAKTLPNRAPEQGRCSKFVAGLVADASSNEGAKLTFGEPSTELATSRRTSSGSTIGNGYGVDVEPVGERLAARLSSVLPISEAIVQALALVVFDVVMRFG